MQVRWPAVATHKGVKLWHYGFWSQHDHSNVHLFASKSHVSCWTVHKQNALFSVSLYQHGSHSWLLHPFQHLLDALLLQSFLTLLPKALTFPQLLFTDLTFCVPLGYQEFNLPPPTYMSPLIPLLPLFLCFVRSCLWSRFGRWLACSLQTCSCWWRVSHFKTPPKHCGLPPTLPLMAPGETFVFQVHHQSSC